MLLGCQRFLDTMKKDPITKKFYSIPAAPDIDQEEYHELLFRCWWISEQLMTNPEFKDTNQKLIK